jgi:hypothetical protein
MKRLVLFSFFAVVLIVEVKAQVPNLKELTLNYGDVSATNILDDSVPNPVGNEKHIAFADYDNDGDLDVAMAVQWSDFGNRCNKLYRNDGGVLVNVAGTAVIPEFSIDDNSCTILFEDFDKDGWKDIVVVCDSNSGTAAFTSPGRTKFYRNHNGQEFVNETDRLNGLTGAASFGAAADFDGNGYLDIVLCDHPNLNQDQITFNALPGNSAGEFTLKTSTHIPPDNEYGKHVATADMNGDGKIDILMGNHSTEHSFIYYNNNNDAGAEDGDFRYSNQGSITEFSGAPSGGIRERGMVPGDFNGDGRIDMYFVNEGFGSSSQSDAIYINIGNDSDNRAVFSVQQMPDELNDLTSKVTVSDLDGDGRDDLIVMSRYRRPYIFRNTTEDGVASFVEWSHPIFNLEDHAGWEARAAQVTGNSKSDLVVGGLEVDYLFEGRDSALSDAGDVASGPFVLPEFFGADPIAVSGSVGVGDEKILVATDLPAGADISILMRSMGDLDLVVEIDGNVIAASSNPGHGSDEWVEFSVAEASNVVIKVVGQALSFDGNGDGIVNLLDVAEFIDCLTGNAFDCDPFDLNDNGNVNLTFVSPFVDAVTSVKSEEEFVVEFLGREF